MNGSVVNEYAKLFYRRVWTCYAFKICLQYEDEYSSTKNASTMPPNQFTSSLLT